MSADDLSLEQKKIKRLEHKIKKYEEVLKDLMDGSDSDNSDTNKYIVEKEKDGTTHILVDTKLGDAFEVIEGGKDLSELRKNEFDMIRCQDDLHNYEKTCEYYKKIGTAWSVTSFVTSVGRLVFGPL